MQSSNSVNILLLIGLFAFVFAGVLGAMLLTSPRDMKKRIEQAGGLAPSASTEGETTTGVWLQKIADISQPIAKLSIPAEGWENSALRIQLMNAGWRSPNAAPVYFAAKTVLALLLPLAALPWLAGSSLAAEPIELAGMLVVLGAVGYYLPNSVLKRRVK